MLQALKEILIKYVSTVMVVLTVGFLALFAYQTHRSKAVLETKYQELIGKVSKYDQLDEYTAKLQSAYESQQALTDSVYEEFQNALKYKNQKIQDLSNAIFTLKQVEDKTKGPDSKLESTDPAKAYVQYELHIAGEKSPPVGFLRIYGSGEALKGNYPLALKVETAQTVNPSTGGVSVYSKAFLVVSGSGNPKWDGVAYPIPITGGTAKIDPTRPNAPKSFMLWAPRLAGGFNLGVEGGSFAARPMLGWSLAGYGYSKKDLDWRFIQVGVDVDTKLSDLGIVLVPILYRPIQALPNTYVGPGLGLTRQGVEYFLNVSVGF